MNRKLKRRLITPLGRLVLGLTLLFTGLAGGSVLVPRALPGGRGCLQFRGTPSNNALSSTWQIDLNTGFYARPLRRPTTLLQELGTSPDERYDAYVKIPNTTTNDDIRPPKGQLFVALGNSETLIQEDALFGFSWSLDSRLMAYVWAQPGAPQVFVTVANPDGSGKRTVALPTPTYFPHWSADGAYFSVKGTQMSPGWIVSVADMRVIDIPVPDKLVSVQTLLWAPTGHRFAYLEQDATKVWVVIASPENSIEHQFELPLMPGTGGLQWSADGRWLLLLDRKSSDNTPAYWRLDLFNVEGEALFNIAENAPSWQDGLTDPSPQWLPDGHTLIFMRGNSEGRLWQSDLMAFDAETRQTTTLIAHTQEWRTPEIGKNRIAIAWQIDVEQDKFAVDLMDADGQHRHRLVDNADAIFRQVWSKDRQSVAVVWLKDQWVVVTWAAADGTNRHEWLTDGSPDTTGSDLKWLEDGSKFLYKGSVDGRWHYFVELVNATTADHHRLAAGGYLTLPATQAEWVMPPISLHWVTGDNFNSLDTEFAAYDIDGRALYNVKGKGLFAVNSLMEISPDGRLALFSLAVVAGSSLQLASTDGQWSKELRTGYDFQAHWSPDGSVIVAAYMVPLSSSQYTSLMLDVMTAHGDLLWHYESFHDYVTYDMRLISCSVEIYGH